MRFPISLRVTPHGTLKALLGLRVFAVAAQLLVLGLAFYAFELALPAGRMMLGIDALALTALFTAWRLRRPWPVTALEVALQLLVDVASLGWLLYHAGGSTNPFASALLVPVALAAVALPAAYALVIAVVCMALYSTLLYVFLPLPEAHHAEGFALHVFGMWVNFLISAGLIAGLLLVLAAGIRRRDALIAAAREEALRNEHIVALGSLAAGAAHELSTPLNTVALLADELALDLADKPQAQQDLALLKQQVAQCKASLSTLLAAAGHTRRETSAPVGATEFLGQTLERWRLLRPQAELSAIVDACADLRLLPEQALAQALINLLNNAADASLAAGSARVWLRATPRDGELLIEIEDEGRGFAEADRARAGHAVFTTKPGGNGLGLVLSNATLARWGGRLSLHARAGGGTLTRVALPLARLQGRVDETPAAG